MIVSLLDRQEDLERVRLGHNFTTVMLIEGQKTQDVLSAVMNATELLQSHNQKLAQASSKTSRIVNDLEKAAAVAKSWGESISVRGEMPDWAIKIISIAGTLAIGNIGFPPTLARNFALLAAG